MKLVQFWKKYSFLFFFIFLVAGLFDFRFALVAIICMVGPVVMAFFKGRFWCGNICPRGSFYDRVVSRFSGKRNPPRFLSSPFFRAFMVLFIFTMFGLNIYLTPELTWQSAGKIFYKIIVLTTFAGMIFALFFNHRTWCAFCPMGTLSSLAARVNKRSHRLEVTSACVSCTLCEKKCPMGLVPSDYKGDKLHHPDCTQCGDCVGVCPKKAIR